MNLSEQHAPAHSQELVVMTALVPAATDPVSTSPLAQLESRLNGMTGTITALKQKVAVLQEMVAHREQRITALESDNAAIQQQADRFIASHNRLLDGLTTILARIPSEESLNAQLMENTMPMGLLAETMGTA